MPRATLTQKQARFVELYLAGGNAAEAYRQAYSSAAPSRSVAREGHRLLKHPKIVPFLTAAEAKARAAQVEAANRYAVSRERNVAELARMAHANIEDLTRKVGEERVVTTGPRRLWWYNSEQHLGRNRWIGEIDAGRDGSSRLGRVGAVVMALFDSQMSSPANTLYDH